MRPSFSRSVGSGVAAALMVVVSAASTFAQQNVSSFSDIYGQHVFYVGIDRHVHEYSSDNPLSGLDLTALTTPASVLVTFGSDLSSFRDGAGEHVFYVGTDQHVHQLFYPSGVIKFKTWVDQDLTVISKWASLVSLWGGWQPLVAFGDATGEYVYYTSMNSYHVHQLYWNNGALFGNGAPWVDRDLSMNVVDFHGACPGFAGFSHPDGEYMYYVSCLDNHVHQVYWNGSASDQDLGVGAEGALTGFSNGTDRFLYFADGPTLGEGWTMHQLAWYTDIQVFCFRGLCREYQWAWMTSSDLPNAPVGVQPQTLTSFADSAGLHVYYAGEEWQVHQLDGTMGPIVPFSNPVSFVDQNLTQATGGSAAPGVVGCAHMSSLSDAAGEHVIYQGRDDGELHMMTSSGGQEVDSVLTAGWVPPAWFLANCTHP